MKKYSTFIFIYFGHQNNLAMFTQSSLEYSEYF